MRGKLLFVTGIAVGYVLGARAGRQRYEQIKSAAESVWNTPAVQSGVDTAKDFALARVGDVSDTVLDGVKKLVSAATHSKAKSAPTRSYSTPARPAASTTRPPTSAPAASVHHTESYTVAEPVDQPAAKKPAPRKPAAAKAPSGQPRKKPSSSESE